jgi:hypothetical protein
MTTQLKLKIPKKVSMEKRTATAYAYIKPSNKKWLEAQAKARRLKVSPTLDLFLDKLRESNPTR